MECSSALSNFGIPTDRLPLKYDGSIKLEDHLQWIAVREAKEDARRQGKPFNVIECPLNMDILAGTFDNKRRRLLFTSLLLIDCTNHSRFHTSSFLRPTRERTTNSKSPG
jgi:hypothetical protein